MYSGQVGTYMLERQRVYSTCLKTRLHLINVRLVRSLFLAVALAVAWVRSVRWAVTTALS